MNDEPIGVFDSGVGGVSVLHVARELLPNEHFIYYGDCLNAPYGTKSLEEIREMSFHVVEYLLSRNVKAILIACNTITSAYAETLRARLSMPIIGMEPAIKPAQIHRHGGEVLALATKATLTLPKFLRLMGLYGESVVPVIGEGLVELVESGKADTDYAEDTLRKVFEPYLNRQIDSIVLGCTHYPFLEKRIRKLFPDAEIYDGRFGTAQQLKKRLTEEGLLSDARNGCVEYISSAGEASEGLMKRLDELL